MPFCFIRVAPVGTRLSLGVVNRPDLSKMEAALVDRGHIGLNGMN